MEKGTMVVWVGKQDPNCAPGYHGIRFTAAAKDENQIKVIWQETSDWLGRYTWERRKNLISGWKGDWLGC